MAVYKLFWDEFSAWYLEMVKPAYGQPISKEVYDRTIGFFDTLLHLLHPFMPFITEELWQHIAERKDGESLMVSPLVVSGQADEGLLQQFEVVKESDCQHSCHPFAEEHCTERKLIFASRGPESCRCF